MLEQLFQAALSHGFSTALLITINALLWRKLNEVENQLIECLSDE